MGAGLSPYNPRNKNTRETHLKKSLTYLLALSTVFIGESAAAANRNPFSPWVVEADKIKLTTPYLSANSNIKNATADRGKPLTLGSVNSKLLDLETGNHMLREMLNKNRLMYELKPKIEKHEKAARNFLIEICQALETSPEAFILKEKLDAILLNLLKLKSEYQKTSTNSLSAPSATPNDNQEVRDLLSILSERELFLNEYIYSLRRYQHQNSKNFSSAQKLLEETLSLKKILELNSHLTNFYLRGFLHKKTLLNKMTLHVQTLLEKACSMPMEEISSGLAANIIEAEKNLLRSQEDFAKDFLSLKNFFVPPKSLNNDPLSQNPQLRDTSFAKEDLYKMLQTRSKILTQYHDNLIHSNCPGCGKMEYTKLFLQKTNSDIKKLEAFITKPQLNNQVVTKYGFYSIFELLRQHFLNPPKFTTSYATGSKDKRFFKPRKEGGAFKRVSAELSWLNYRSQL